MLFKVSNGRLSRPRVVCLLSDSQAAKGSSDGSSVEDTDPMTNTVVNTVTPKIEGDSDKKGA